MGYWRDKSKSPNISPKNSPKRIKKYSPNISQASPKTSLSKNISPKQEKFTSLKLVDSLKEEENLRSRQVRTSMSPSRAKWLSSIPQPSSRDLNSLSPTRKKVAKNTLVQEPMVLKFEPLKKERKIS